MPPLCRCIGLAAFTAGYCLGRVQGTSEAERNREKEMRAWERSQQVHARLPTVICCAAGCPDGCKSCLT